MTFGDIYFSAVSLLSQTHTHKPKCMEENQETNAIKVHKMKQQRKVPNARKAGINKNY